MKRINILYWFFFHKKRYNAFEYIIKLGFDSDSSYLETKNLSKSAIEYLIKN